MNVSSLTPWLSDSIQFDFLAVLVVCAFKLVVFVVVLLWLYKEAQCIYLRLHLGWKLTILELGLFYN